MPDLCTQTISPDLWPSNCRLDVKAPFYFHSDMSFSLAPALGPVTPSCRDCCSVACGRFVRGRSWIPPSCCAPRPRLQSRSLRGRSSHPPRYAVIGQGRFRSVG